jgi:hypothetical protein
MKIRFWKELDYLKSKIKKWQRKRQIIILSAV